MDDEGGRAEAMSATARASRVALLFGSDGDAALARIAGVLSTARDAWTVRRPAAGTRLAVKRAVDAALDGGPDALVLVWDGTVIAHDGGALLLAGAPARYADDEALPVAWLRGRLAQARPRLLALVVSGDERGGADDELVTLPAHPDALVVVGGGRATLTAVAEGLAGAGGHPPGAVSLAQLGSYLTRVQPGARISASTDEATLVTPQPGALASTAWWSSAPAAEQPGDPGGATSVASGVDVVVGSVLPGRFRLDAELAHGTFGTVFRARQLTVERDVAVKVLNADIDSASADGQLFLHEVRAIGRLDHRNVVRLFHADVAPGGRLFLVMELLAGPTLAQLAAAGPLPLARAVDLVTQLLAGLGAAHGAGLIHADVKPENAMVVSDPDARHAERLVLLDFGLARLRRPGEDVAAAGGTPAFMAPEQLRAGRVDARSDLFAAALVLVYLATGWRRRNARELVPPLDGIEEPRVRAALERALAEEPRARFDSAAALAAALTGDPAPPTRPPRPPFHRLASFTEADHDRLRGRDRELARLVDYALFRSAGVLTAPSGTGKTSLLRAGLVPHLRALGVRVIYASARERPMAAICEGLAPGAATVADALARRAAGGRVVVVLDQLEACLLDGGGAVAALLTPLLAGDPDVAVVMSVREDFLARLLTVPLVAAVGPPLVRLGPMDVLAARDALVMPLAEHRITVEPALLDVVVAELARAAAEMAPELGWGGGAAVFPPHLQLVGAVLFDALAPDEEQVTLRHYQQLGGLPAIVGEHLERVLETELDDRGAATARELFLALVSGSHARATRDEPELLAQVHAPPEHTLAVLEVLRTQGLVVRIQRAAGEPAWELVHDSLVPRVLGWIDRRDLARRQALEQVRYHLRRSRGGALSLLSRVELRELSAHPGALAELTREHERRADGGVEPTVLVARSRQAVRRSLGTLATLAVVVVALVGLVVRDRQVTAATAARARSLIDRDLGRFTLVLAPFDWQPPGVDVAAPGGRARAVAVGLLPALRWTLHDPDPDDPSRPGPPRPPSRVLVRPVSGQPGTFAVEASGGAAFLVLDGRARAGEAPCGPSLVPVRALPGFARRALPAPTYTVAVPTCQATRADLLPIAAGTFVEGGPGEPPSAGMVAFEPAGHDTVLPAYALDRTEVTNAAYTQLASMTELTGVTAPVVPRSPALEHAREPGYPVSGLDWFAARRYCAFLGKRLPTSAEWQKAVRGPRAATTEPRAALANFPWHDAVALGRANLNEEATTGRAPAPAPVGSFPLDRGPYGHLDLAGNVQEWTASHHPDGSVIIRGGNWAETLPDQLVDYMAFPNPREATTDAYYFGVRCAL